MGLKDVKRKRKELEELVSNYETAFSGLYWQEGLPTCECGQFAVILLDDGIQIVDQEEHTYRLAKNQLQKVFYTASVEEYKVQKRSLVKGIVMGQLFGTAGAIIGSAPKEKTVCSPYTDGALVIQYTSDQGEEKDITLSLRSTGHDKNLKKLQAFAERAQRLF